MAPCRGLIAAFALTVLALTTASRGAEVKGPWVATDRTVDCSSYETIMKGVLKAGMSDEEKAIALYSFYRQRVYHYMNMPESRDPVKCVNVIGNTLCGSQATCMKGLLGAAGIRARVVSHPGHTFYEAFYGGKWHGYDTMCNFYVFTRGGKRNVASFEELSRDPTLIRDAVREKRAVGGICPCGDNPANFSQRIRVLGYEPRKSGWSVKDYSLREGEQIVRSWWPHGKPLPGTHRRQDPGPMHTCGSRDRKNPPELFRFWEPYGIPRYGGVSISYRHYFNGFMDFSPDLAKVPYAAALAGGELVVPVKCPFYITGSVLKFEASCRQGGSVEVSASADGRSWKTMLTARDAGKKEYRVVLDAVAVRKSVGRHTYQVRFRTAKAKLERFHLKTIFQHNAMAAPHLMPGKNTVTLDAVPGAPVSAACPLTVIYRYKEAPGWTEEKSVERKATRLPFTFEVSLPETKKLPQMQDMAIRCGELAWEPKRAELPDRVLCDFRAPDAVKKWSAGAEMKLSHDGKGLLIEVPAKSQYPQASMGGLKEDWSGFQNVVVELENLGRNTQSVILRVRSNEDNKERTDVEQKVAPGKAVMRVPVSGLKKTKLDAVTKVYLMMYQVPDGGCRVRVTRIYLEPKQDL